MMPFAQNSAHHRPVQAGARSAFPLPGPPEGLLAQAACLLTERGAEALTAWKQRVQQHGPWSEQALCDASADSDDRPVLLDAVLFALCAGTRSASYESGPDAWERIRRQVRVRRRQQVPLVTVLTEQVLLRDELWVFFDRWLPIDRYPRETFALARAVDGTLYRLQELTLQVYGETLEMAQAE